MTKKYKIGIIAEDESDFISIKTLICRIANNYRLSTEKFIGKGCGKIKRKCNSWATTLKTKGCTVLFVVHDLDSNDLKTLQKEIRSSLEPCPIIKNLIVIPVQELEAWLLSDPEGIKKSLKLNKPPKIKSNTEMIDSPKEYLGNAIFKASNYEKPYINTKHNKIISEAVSINIIRNKCKSFIPFYDFIKTNL